MNMDLKKYEYTPGIIILYNFLRFKKNMDDLDFMHILALKGHKELLKIIDIEQVAKLAIEAIEKYYLKVCSLDYKYFFLENDLENLDYFMDISLYASSKIISKKEIINDMSCTIRYFHDYYIYHNANLTFPYVNKDIPYNELTVEEKNDELYILFPIFSAFGEALGEVDYDNGSFNLNEDIKNSLNENLKEKTALHKNSNPSLKAYYEYRNINEATAAKLGLVYKIENDVIEITDYTGKGDTLIIPKTIDNIAVKTISGINEKEFKKMVVLADLDAINSYSIYNCTSLQSVEVDGSLGLIGKSTFSNSLLSETIVDEVLYLCINNNLYYLAVKYGGRSSGCVILNENCKSIMEGAFYNKSFHYLGVSSVEYIGNHAFENCNNLISVLLNKNLKGIGECAFYLCSSLKRIRINVKILPMYLFYGCTHLINVELGDKVEVIGTYVFFDCNSLEKLLLPKSIKELKESAFEYLPLKNLYFEEYYFWDGKGLDGNVSFIPQDLYDPSSAARLFKKHDENSFKINTKYENVISLSIDEAQEYGFTLEVCEDDTIAITDCEKEHTELVIPKYIDNKKVTELGGGLLSFCLETLEKLIILADIKSIASGSFGFCKNLKEIIMPNTLEKMGIAFAGANLLHTKRDGICYLKINNNPYYCSLSTYGEYSQLNVHPNTKILARCLFSECKAKQVILSDVQRLPYRLFYQAKNLEEIYIPSSVLAIEEEVFLGCEKLVTCDMNSCYINTISKSMFENCTSLAELSLPDGVTKIEENAFCNCTSLKMLSIPDSIFIIEKGAFTGCVSLATIDLDDSKWEYTGPFGPIYFSNFYSTHPSLAAADLVSKHRGVCKKYLGTDEEFEKLRNQDSTKSKMLLNIYYSNLIK